MKLLWYRKRRGAAVNRVVAFLLAVVTVYVVGVLAYSQLNLAALVELGMPVTAEVRLSTFVHDLLGMTQIFLPVVIVSLLLALPVANLIVRKVPQLTVIGYISAGFMAMLVMNTILSQAVGGTHPLAVTRTFVGLMSQCIAGALGGYVYVVTRIRHT